MALLLEMIYSLDVDTLIFIFCSVLASGDFCRLQMAVANSLDPDQDQQNVGTDLDPNYLTL